jgi:hypothetical protein
VGPRALCVLAAAVAIGGCAPLGGPSADPSAGPGAVTSAGGAAPPAPSTASRADTTHEVPTPPPPSETTPPGAAASTPTTAVRAFATAYINWSAPTVKRDLLILAARSVGQARSAMLLAAAQTAGDYELHQGGIGNSGTVEAVAPLPGHADQYVVVTREMTTAANSNAYAGLRPAWHVTIATVRAEAAAGGRWVVSGWQPES